MIRYVSYQRVSYYITFCPTKRVELYKSTNLKKCANVIKTWLKVVNQSSIISQMLLITSVKISAWNQRNLAIVFYYLVWNVVWMVQEFHIEYDMFYWSISFIRFRFNSFKNHIFIYNNFSKIFHLYFCTASLQLLIMSDQRVISSRTNFRTKIFLRICLLSVFVSSLLYNACTFSLCTNDPKHSLRVSPFNVQFRTLYWLVYTKLFNISWVIDNTYWCNELIVFHLTKKHRNKFWNVATFWKMFRFIYHDQVWWESDTGTLLHWSRRCI